MFRGYLDTVGPGGHVTGWAINGLLPSPVTIKVNGLVLATPQGGAVRNDLEAAGLPKEAGFALMLPGLKAGDVVEALFPNGGHLVNSPWLVHADVGKPEATAQRFGQPLNVSAQTAPSEGMRREVLQNDVKPKYHCWGIGLGRTGTTTLCNALTILGYSNVIHNPTFEQLRTASGGSDNGVTIYYKYLDYKFPKSKFVLTMRDLDSWLPSIKYITDKFPVQTIDEDEPIKRRMLLYDTVVFDRDLFIKAYFKHIDSVRAYFRSRPHDLLEIDITKGDGWEKLCPFLELPVPTADFPHLNKRK